MIHPRVNIGRKGFQSTLAEFRQYDNVWKSLGGSQVNFLANPRPEVALGLPSENPSGGLHSTPRAYIENSRDRPRAQIHLATPYAFPHIFILSKFRKS